MFYRSGLKTLLASVGVTCALSLNSAQAAISDDGVASLGLAGGSGQGDMFFSIYDATNSKALVLDLGLSVASFVANPTAPFAITNAALTDFIATGDASAMQWNVAGINNSPNPDFSNIYMLLTVDPDSSPQAFANPSVQIDAMSAAGSYLQSVNNNIIGDVAETAAATTWLAGSWADSIGGNSPGYSTSSNFEGGAFETLAMFRVGFTGDGSASVLQTLPGLETVFWNLDAATGELSVSAVPIPGAVWLLGSAVAGLMSYRRRG